MEKEQRSDDGRAPGQQDESPGEEDPQEQQPSALVRRKIAKDMLRLSLVCDSPQYRAGRISSREMCLINQIKAELRSKVFNVRATHAISEQEILVARLIGRMKRVLRARTRAVYALSLREIRIFAQGIPEIQALISGVRVSSMMMLPFQRYHLMLIVRRRTVYFSDGRISVVTSAWIFNPLDRSINEIRYGPFIRQERVVPALDFSSASQAMTPIGQMSFNPQPPLVIPATRDIAVRHRFRIFRDVPKALNVQLNRMSICYVPEANSADRSTNARSSSPEPLTCGAEEGQADPHDDEGFGDGASDSSGADRENDETPEWP